jgi:hypothetical protein
VVAVDEGEWLSAVVPHAMINHLRGRATDRKQRLLVCASSRRLWYLLPGPGGRELLDGAERYADGLIGREELQRLCQAARGWAFCESGFDQLAYLRSVLARPSSGQSDTGWKATETALVFLLNFSAALAARQIDFATSTKVARQGCVWNEEARAQADLLREVMGNPFRPSPPLPRDVLRWNDALVPRLAQAVYDGRRWPDLPFLSDALLDAGCEDEALMSHCRGGGEHAHGCWAVDSILGKG